MNDVRTSNGSSAGRRTTGVLAAGALLLAATTVRASAIVTDATHRLEGRLIVHVSKDPDSLGSRFAHDHVIRAGSWTGTARIDIDTPACAIEIVVPVADLVVDEPELRAELGVEGELDPKDRERIRTSMLAFDQLAAERYPEVRFRTESCRPAAPDRFEVHGELTLRGQTRRVTVDVPVERHGDTFAVTAELSIRGSDFGMEPYSALFGAVRNRDELTFEVRIEAIPLDATQPSSGADGAEPTGRSPQGPGLRKTQPSLSGGR